MRRGRDLLPGQLALFIFVAILGGLGASILEGRAPVGPYRGPDPAPGAVLAFTGGPAPAGASAVVRARLEPGSTDAARAYLGRLVTAPGAEVQVLLAGDNRPGSWASALMLGEAPAWRRPFMKLRDAVERWQGRPSAGGEQLVFRALVRALPADLALSSGDLVTDGRRGRQWADYATRSAPLRTRVLSLAVPGNHDRFEDPLGAAAAQAVLGPPAAPGAWWFALDVPEAGARFVALDSPLFVRLNERGATPDDFALARAQLAWADSALAAPARWRFLVLHHPLVTSGHHLDTWGAQAGAPARAFRDSLLALCAARGVTAVLCGHEHVYQRVWIDTPAGGFWQITAGGAGAPLYPLEAAQRKTELTRPLPAGLAADTATALTRRIYHYGRIGLPPVGAGRDPRLVVYEVDPRGRGVPVDSLDLARPGR